MELTIPEYDPETGTYGTFTATFADGTGAEAFLHDGAGLTAIAWTDGEKPVDGVTLTFEEPFEGPTPLETEVSVPAFADLHKWTQSGTSTVPSAWELTVQLVDEKGNALDAATTSGDGAMTGPVYHNRRDGQEEKYMEIVCTDGR